MTGEPAGRRSSEELDRENRRLTRHLQRLEENVRRLEEFQDANATLPSRLLTELEEERAKSQRLLLPTGGSGSGSTTARWWRA